MIGTDTSRTPPPLPPEVETLLAHERVVLPLPEIMRARTLARAREALRDMDVMVPAPRRTALPVHRLLYAAAAGLVLIAGSAAAYQMLRHPEPTPLTSGAIPSAESHTQVVPPVAPAPAVAPATLPKASAPSHRAEVTGKSAARLEELRLLVRARQADARREYSSVMSILAEHERGFPSGRLSEEREVLRVKALVGLGRIAEARQVGASFRRQFPHSVLLHKVEDMLASPR
jgi:hypothetical protein